MKKIIALFVLFFAFSLNATAQDNSEKYQINAKKDLQALVSTVTVDNNMHMAFYNLFIKKHKEMDKPTLTENEKNNISSSIEAKLRASLNAEQMITLEKNKAVFAQLISGTPSTEIKEKK